MAKNTADSSNVISNVMRSDEWKSLSVSINHLFRDRALRGHGLDVLNEKVRNLKELGLDGTSFISLYKDSILKSAMIVLKYELKEKEKKGNVLEILSEIWTDFYRSILPYLHAIFYPIQTNPKINFGWVNLIGFRDLVLFKSKISEVLVPGQNVSNQVKQMLLIITSVRDTDESGNLSSNYFKMEELTSRVIRPFLGVRGIYKVSENVNTKPKQSPIPTKERKVSRSLRVEIKKLNCTSASISPDEKEMNNNRNNEFVNRLRHENSPRNENQHSVNSAKSSSGISSDEDMREYWQMRQERWKNKEDTLDTESLS